MEIRIGSSEVFASGLLTNIEEMFPRYYMHSDIQIQTTDILR